MRLLVSMVGVAVIITSGGGLRGDRQDLRAHAAVPAIVQTFKNHRLVAIGEMHRNQQVHDLIVALLGDREFLPDGGDVVVEWGSSQYQTMMDRYVAGERVPREHLVHAWRDTVNILVWDAPVYERLFRTVRSVNRSRHSGGRLRVLLADPPIDWSSIHDRAAWELIAATRDRHAADIVERESLARGRRALLIFGSGHIQNEGAFDRYGKSGRTRSPNLAELLQARHPGTTFFILADWMTPELDARLAGVHPPALAQLHGTSLGDVHVGPPESTPRLKELADAFLFLGSTTSLTVSTPSPAIYRDRAYLRELRRRDAIQGGANAAELARLEANGGKED
jgi:hypothetical protein